MTTVGVKVDLDVDGLVSNAGRARGSISALTEEIKKAEKEGRPEDVGRLAFERDRLQGSNFAFEKDIKSLTSNPRLQTQTTNGTVVKIDSEYAGLIQKQIDAMRNLTAQYNEAIKSGDVEKSWELLPQIEKQQADFHKVVEDANRPDGTKSAAEAVKAIGINQIAGAINDGFSRWVGSLDRSGIVNQYGSGDILGGRISEERRQADLAGGILQSVLSIGGTALGFGLGGPGGAILGGTVGGGAGKFIDTALKIGPANEANEAAYAGLWQNRSGQAMELAAITGSVNDVRGAFKTAADAAAEFGYSAEEGMEAMKEAARQGLSGKEAADMAGNVFDYERRTGADRSTLMGISTMAARYGAGDALGAGWQGLQASGMKQGQYNEYLRAMQRVMEDGISKGFSKSAKEIAGDLTFIKEMSGGSELWKGEQGQQRLSQMSAGLEASTGLASSSDILAFRGAQNVLKGMDDEGWKKITDLDKNGTSDIKRSGSYIDAMILMERGLNADTFSEIMKLNDNAEGGDRSAVVERMRQQFGLNYTNSAMLYDQWAQQTDYGTKEMSTEDAQALVDTYGKKPADNNSPEFEAAKKIEEIKNLWTQTGIMKWDENFPETLLAELRNAEQEYDKATGRNEPIDTSGMTPIEAWKVWQQEYMDAIEAGDSDRANQAYIEMEKANMDALTPHVDPIDEETRNMGEIDRMLIKSGMSLDKDRTAFFTGDGKLLAKNDDEKAFDRFMAYGKEPAGSPVRQAFDEYADYLKTLSPEKVRNLNESDKINELIPDVMTDRTGQLLLEALRELKEFTLRYEEE